MSAIDRELKVLRGFCSCAGDMAAVDEAEAEVAAFRARTDAQAQEIARLTAELAQTQRDRQAEHDLRVTMQGEAETLRARLAEAEAEYADLIFRVSEKHPGETRHETARRYIEQAERATDGAARGGA